MIARPKLSETPEYYRYYLNLLTQDDVLSALAHNTIRVREVMGAFPEASGDFRYAPEKWTVKQLLQHIIDTERIFSYRLMRLARRDSTALQGFDENWFAQHDNSSALTLVQVCEEFEAVRRATEVLVSNVPADNWDFRGNANGMEVTPRAIAWMIAGHSAHHVRILVERYVPTTT
jgi:uncharacterized damage-inducible protein DinB